jgi:hypothetical protein
MLFLENGNIGVIVENNVDKRRYHVESNDKDKKCQLGQFIRVLQTSLCTKSDALEKLINKGDYSGLPLPATDPRLYRPISSIQFIQNNHINQP